MGTTLYLDCASGISGDMTVAALLDLGLDASALQDALATLPVGGFRTVVSRVNKHGLDACDFDVVLDADLDNHDHDMDYLYDHLRAAGLGAKTGEHEHVHEHAHDSGHVHDHAHDSGHHHHHHRGLAEVLSIVDGSALPDGAKAIARRVFQALAEAEAKAHGATPQTVMFHEVGAVDSIVDVAAAAWCLDALGVTDVVVPSLSEGRGTVRCAHGVMPIPVPAVANLVAAHGIDLVPAGVPYELVTPTGAAIVAACRTAVELPARYRVLRIGTGAGKRAYEGVSGTLRAMLIADDAPGGAHAAEGMSNRLVKLECDIDDSTGETLGRVIDALMAAGARDAHALPSVMKKGRPGYQLQVLCGSEDAERLRGVIYRETTAIGVRSAEMDCWPLPRAAAELQTAYGPVAAKRVELLGGGVRIYPESDAVLTAARAAGASYQDVFRAAVAAAVQAEQR